MTQDTLFDGRPKCDRCGEPYDGPWWEVVTHESNDFCSPAPGEARVLADGVEIGVGTVYVVRVMCALCARDFIQRAPLRQIAPPASL